MSSRPPVTSYGYPPPRDAKVRGWACNNEDCGTGDEPAPKRWPHPCHLCGRPTDPTFEEPWAHQARGYAIRHDLAAGGPRRPWADVEQHVWAYRDAWLRDDAAGKAAAWDAYRRARGEERNHHFGFELIAFAAKTDDIDRATAELLDWYPHVDTGDPENDNQSRTDVRGFVSLCARVRERPASIGHPRAADLEAAMRDVLHRAREWITDDTLRVIRSGEELRAVHAAGQALVEAGRADTVRTGLPRSGDAEADAALQALEIDDDPAAVDAMLARATGAPGLLALLRARRLAFSGDLPAALRVLTATTDGAAGRLRPQIRATAGILLAAHDTDAIDRAIEMCGTASPSSLARLLLWRGRPGDTRDAVRLARRRCRPWRRPSVEERIVLLDALAAGSDDGRQARAWRRAAAGRWTITEHVRLATAWAAWAVRTADPYLAAEAYWNLVRFVPFDAATRSGTSARQRVLTAAQEHTEEAGYWLTRIRRYREAAIALETGRAIGLREGEDPIEVTYDDILAATGDGALVYIAAARAGGYALVVAAHHDPQLVELRTLDRATVDGLLGQLLPDARTGGVRGALRDLAPAQPTMADPMARALKTLWDGGMQNLVLSSARGRVVTFVPVGLLSLLPLHAAGEPGAPGDRYREWRHAGNFSAVRYAPNARELRRCLQQASQSGPHRLFAVDVPQATGPYLHHVALETAEVGRRWGGEHTLVHDCTWEQFRAAADSHTVWHLACHGSARPESILDSRLCFADREVTLGELRQTLRPGRRRLAVLSACESNLTGAAMPNEVVGLPSALLQAGFAGVIASSWKVDDLATAYLMTEFYEQWCGAGHEPAIALNLAQQWLRTATHDTLAARFPHIAPGGGEGPYPYLAPRYWAAFAYTGA